MTNIDKSRNLSIFRYFEQLQLEYIVAELRKKIYPIVKDKGYYGRVMDQKKKKIQDIALRNSLESIFDSSTFKSEIYQKVYNPKGVPNFLYRDNKMEEEYKEKDLKYYFLEGSEVKIIKDQKTLIGIIESINLEAGLVEIKFSDEKFETLPMGEVTRIL